MLRKISWYIVISLATLYIWLLLYVPSSQVPQYTSDDLIRLHVIANSDNPVDQALKLAVKDKIVELVRSEISANDVADAHAQIEARLQEFEAAAAAELERQGQPYPVKAILGPANFPTKYYGSFSLPAGEYEALRLVIGEGRGQNWWCVLFPPLCFVDNDTATAALQDLDLQRMPSEEIIIRFRLLEKGKQLVEQIESWFRAKT
ncbi:MAG: stage II sporulation protein R [Bacillota bacterium]